MKPGAMFKAQNDAHVEALTEKDDRTRALRADEFSSTSAFAWGSGGNSVIEPLPKELGGIAEISVMTHPNSNPQ